MSEIVVNNISVTYQLDKKRTVNAIKNCSAIFKDGEFNVVIGPSGCGKTTLLKALLGLIPFEGDVTLDGVDIYDYSTGERNFAYVSQDIVLQPHVTVFDNIAYPLKIRGMDKKTIVEKVNEIAADLNISECLSRKPKQISLGQAQRVAIARALIKNANFYFFDEPFSNLDQANRDNGRALLIKTIQKYHASVIYVTHSINEATSIADKIFVMSDGAMVFSGTPEEVLSCEIPEVKSLIDANDK
ncbi:MAG: ABC transporter ATP-binding protein [Bacilli bacterium]|nr:ABC transporter ATP-binding protein [Bacilli bacterium]